MATAEALNRGRESYRQRKWGDAVAQLSEADVAAPLDAEDLERLATAAYLAGRDGESTDVLTRAHSECLQHGDMRRAARCAFWLGFGLAHRGEMARASGWLTKAQRLLDENGIDSVERGYLLFPAGLQLVMQGDFTAAYEVFGKAVEVGIRFQEDDLITIARHGQGRALIKLGETEKGLSLLDEVMASIVTGEISPIISGIVYCSVIEACQEIFDLRRAQEWTAALTHWCESQQDLVPYRGQCMVHRAEIMQVHGEWRNAMEEADRAYDRLSQPPVNPAVGAAFYRRADLHRLQGEFGKAEEAYREASQWGHPPEPGIALLWLVKGKTNDASAAIKRVLDETDDPIPRSKLLSACVEIMLDSGDVSAARAAADELSRIADHFGSALLRASADTSEGAAQLAEGDARGALSSLRRAYGEWQRLEAPYDAARTRELIGLACTELEDHGTAQMEFDAARREFNRLGAAPDVARIDAMPSKSRDSAGGLTGRELEVLRLVAAGKTNRAIAGDLVISEKTVARHVSNIFGKLDLSSRSSATAYAYEHGLL